MRMSRRAAFMTPLPSSEQSTRFVGFYEVATGIEGEIIGEFTPGEWVEISLDDSLDYQDPWWHIAGVGSWDANNYVSVDFEYLDSYEQRMVTFIMPAFDVAVDVEQSWSASD